MIIILPNGEQLRGDWIKHAVHRNDLAPVMESLEADIRHDPELEVLLKEGNKIQVGVGNFHRIIRHNRQIERASQGDRHVAAIKIITALDIVANIAFLRESAVILEKKRLTEIYRACGCPIPTIRNDFVVPRFYTYVGGTPSFLIPKLLHEEGGVLQYREGVLTFYKNTELAKMKPRATLPENVLRDSKSEFATRHDAPNYYSDDMTNTVIKGKWRVSQHNIYSPYKTKKNLNDMEDILEKRDVITVEYSFGDYFAGDVIELTNKLKLSILTAAHVFDSGTDGTNHNHITKLWVAEMRV